MPYKAIVVDTLNGIQDAQYSAESSKPNFDKWRNYGVELYNFIKSLQKLGFTEIAVLGDFGSGKSFGISTLKEGECMWYNSDAKNPTWRGGKQIFGTKTKPTAHQMIPSSYQQILNDIQSKGRAAFSENPVAFVIGHTEEYKAPNGEVRYRLKILGNLARNLSVEGLFENTLYTHVVKDKTETKYYFRTKNSGSDTCRTMEGLFEDELIPNDFSFILKKLDEY
jgi:hypothetical protein